MDHTTFNPRTDDYRERPSAPASPLANVKHVQRGNEKTSLSARIRGSSNVSNAYQHRIVSVLYSAFHQFALVPRTDSQATGGGDPKEEFRTCNRTAADEEFLMVRCTLIVYSHCVNVRSRSIYCTAGYRRCECKSFVSSSDHSHS